MKVPTPPIGTPPLLALTVSALCGAVLVAASVATADLSPVFVYGGPYLARPVWTLVLLLEGAGLFYLAGIAALARVQPSRAALGAVLAVSLACQAIQLGTTPMLEDDFYRYLLDGGVTACGENPYVLTPGQQAKALATVRSLAEGAPDTCLGDDARWPGVLERVAFPKVRTIYPPLAQWWFAAVVGVAGPSVLALRVSLLAASALLMLSLATLLARLGMSPLLVAVWGWAPLVFKEMINSAHYDAVPAALLTLALLAMVTRRVRVGLFALGLAAAAKLFAVALVPLWLRSLPRRERAPAMACFVAGVVLPCLPFVGAGRLLWSGAWTFAVDWQVNAPVFAPAAAALSGLGMTQTGARVVCQLLVGAAVAWLALRWPVAAGSRPVSADHASSCRALATGSLAILGVLLVCGPVGNPWYYCWLLPLVALAPRPSWLVLTASLPLSYLGVRFLYESAATAALTGDHTATSVGPHAWLLAAEFGPFFVLLARERFRPSGAT